MTPNEIIVGKIYENLRAPGFKYLGCGKRILWEGLITNDQCNFNSKFLVIIEDGESGFLGQVIQDPVDCMEGYWDDFVELKVD